MRKRTLSLALCLVLGGCAASSIASQEDANVTSSLQFDAVACDQLVAQRNALAAQYSLPQDAKPEFTNLPPGFSPAVPDIRSSRQRGADQARGRIDAMNRSLIRRQCIKAPAS